ncbi:hypothetical protein AB3N58_10350 [Leptospira sp. WS60.C2]
MKHPQYLIKSNLSEKQIELDVSRYFGWITPVDMNSFILLESNESLTGADVEFDSGILLYLQFKVSEGLKSTSVIKPSQRRNRSKMEEIRIFRNINLLNDDPTLFFKIRKKALHAEDLQHNILLSFEKPPISRAFYVAPLCLDKNQYQNILFNSHLRHLTHPFSHSINLRIYQNRWKSYLGSIPILRNHISIPPHERVKDDNHYYAYSENGDDISWHSEEIISREPRRFTDTIIEIIEDINKGILQFVSLDQLNSFLLENNPQTRLDTNEILKSEENNSLSQIQAHGRMLYKKHQIKQFLLLKRKQ